MEKPEVVALNKTDSLTKEDIKKKITSLKRATKSPVFAISAIAGTNTTECLREIAQFVPTKQKKTLPDDDAPIQNEPIKKTWSPLD